MANKKSTQKNSPSKFALWVAGARLRTLPLAVAPVAIGAGAAAGVQSFNALLSLAALAVALLLQIGVNYANDYSDGIRGTDDFRVGPTRLTASRLVPASAVKRAAFLCFGLAAAIGLAIVLVTQSWVLLALGAVAIVAAWFYTGGKRPYGYMGLGEVSVFVFFGLVEVLGTTYVLVKSVWLEPILLGVAHGLFACAVLLVNNIRDRETDIVAGKRTLATRVPMWLNRVLFGVYMLVPFVILTWFALTVFNTWWAYFALFLAIPAVLITSTAKTAPEYVLALKLSVWTSLVFASILAWTLAF